MYRLLIKALKLDKLIRNLPSPGNNASNYFCVVITTTTNCNKLKSLHHIFQK